MPNLRLEIRHCFEFRHSTALPPNRYVRGAGAGRFRKAFSDCDSVSAPLTRMGMQRGLAVFFCTLLFFTAGCASHGEARAEKREHETAARSAALHWLNLLDQGDYEEAFEWEAQDFRIART